MTQRSIWLAGFLAWCVSAAAARAQPFTVGDAVRRHLAAEIQLHGVELPPVAPERLMVFPDSSVLPGARLTWGGYRARRHGVLWALAAEADGRVWPIRNPAHWNALARSLGWSPSSDESLVRACQEMLRFTDPGRRPAPVLSVFHGWAGVDTLRVTGRAELRSRLRPPRVVRDSTGAPAAEVWVIGEGWAARYACSFSPADGLQVRSQEIIHSAGYVDLFRPH